MKIKKSLIVLIVKFTEAIVKIKTRLRRRIVMMKTYLKTSEVELILQLTKFTKCRKLQN